MASTLKAMKRVQEIQQVREKRFYEKRYLLYYLLMDRMALAKEQQRLQKKIVIARVSFFISLECRMLSCCVLLLLRRRRMCWEQNKSEKISKLAKRIFFVSVRTRTKRILSSLVIVFDTKHNYFDSLSAGASSPSAAFLGTALWRIGWRGGGGRIPAYFIILH